MRVVWIFALLTSAACAQAERLTLVTSQNRSKLSFQRQDGILINEKCKTKLASCMAYQRFQAREPATATQAGLTTEGSPAAAYCKENQGSPLLLINEKQDEILICAFPDETMIDAWALFEQRKKK